MALILTLTITLLLTHQNPNPNPDLDPNPNSKPPGTYVSTSKTGTVPSNPIDRSSLVQTGTN